MEAPVKKVSDTEDNGLKPDVIIQFTNVDGKSID
jgi:hypothetical protein